MRYRNQNYIALKSGDCIECDLFDKCHNLGEDILIHSRETCFGKFRDDGEEEGKKHPDCDEDEECTLQEWIEYYIGERELDFYDTCEQYFDRDDYETFKYTHTNKNGDKVVAFGYYGYN